MSQPKRILITGATGFLGSALTRLFGESADNLVRTSLHGKGTSVRACDLIDPEAVNDLIAHVEPTHVYHLAGLASNNLSEAFAANVLATHHLLEAVLLQKRPCRVLLVGSAAEYGQVRPEDNPVSESQPLRPSSLYGLTKTYQTALMEFCVRTRAMDIVMARPFNVYGAGAGRHTFAGNVYAQIEQRRADGHSPIVTGNLDAELDYLEVGEVARAIQTVMEFGKTGNVYNVGSGKPIRMRDFLAELLAKANIPWSAVVEKKEEQRAVSPTSLLYADISQLTHLTP